MSQIKSSSNNCDSSNDTNGSIIISSDLRFQLNKIIKDLERQTFFDSSLSNEHRLYILNNQKMIENEFINIVRDKIQGLNIDSDIRQRLIANLDKFNTYYTPIDNNSDITTRFLFNFPYNYDSDEESHAQDDSNGDDIYSDDDNDLCDDLENLILDEIEFEHDMNAFFE